MLVNVAGNELSWEILYYRKTLKNIMYCTDPSQNLMGPGRSINGAVAGVGVGVSSLSEDVSTSC